MGMVTALTLIKDLNSVIATTENCRQIGFSNGTKFHLDINIHIDSTAPSRQDQRKATIAWGNRIVAFPEIYYLPGPGVWYINRVTVNQDLPFWLGKLIEDRVSVLRKQGDFAQEEPTNFDDVILPVVVP